MGMARSPIGSIPRVGKPRLRFAHLGFSTAQRRDYYKRFFRLKAWIDQKVRTRGLTPEQAADVRTFVHNFRFRALTEKRSLQLPAKEALLRVFPYLKSKPKTP